MKVCETIQQNADTVVRCFEYELLPTFTGDIRDSLLYFTICCFITVFIVKMLKHLFLGA
ncbi:hypothetical protein [Acinetobacter chinensis]|uniref:hypothetical protein n=1 Tax=Acinetobacter chinensis TaxID=2004650 RepID=UPI00135BC103|nr:hypothetical protein [Acinetobacter chinensis]